jgi:4-hydroxybenzoate polyprenyltransferase
MRFPAVFTAITDVMMGILVTCGTLVPYWQSGLLIAASAGMYLAGMVLNDVFDADLDARERPERPIPSGRITLAAAQQLGSTLLSGGVMLAWIVALLADSWRPGVVGTLLLACILLYDGLLKQLAIAPLVMGACRFLNVLLGMSLAKDAATPTSFRPWTTAEWLVAAGLGIYVVGVTIFARTEADAGPRKGLAIGIGVMLAGIALLGYGAVHVGNESRFRWIVWIVVSIYIALRHALALMSNDSQSVQRSVRIALRMLIFLDFLVAFEAAPHSGGCMLILLLYVPMLALEYWFSTT